MSIRIGIALAAFAVGLAALIMTTKHGRQSAAHTGEVAESPIASGESPQQLATAVAAEPLTLDILADKSSVASTAQLSPENNPLTQYADAKPLKAEGLANTVRWVSEKEVGYVSLRKLRAKAARISSASMKPRAIESRDAAVAHLEINLSMAVRPAVAFEDAEFFYFSGGNTAYVVTDFSSGIAINKATGEIVSW
jgi:hypothetical protein